MNGETVQVMSEICLDLNQRIEAHAAHSGAVLEKTALDRWTKKRQKWLTQYSLAQVESGKSHPDMSHFIARLSCD
jgi:hypothetical protein